MKFGQQGIVVACLALAAPAFLAANRAHAEEDIRGKTIRYSRTGVEEEVVIRILKSGRFVLTRDTARYKSSCRGGGSEGVEGILGRNHQYRRGCKEDQRAASTRAAYAGRVLTIHDTHKAGHTFYTTYRITISGRTCSGTESGGYRSLSGYTSAPTYSISPCVIE